MPDFGWEEHNRDGWIDFYVSNDATAKHLYLGNPDLTFQEIGVISGTAFGDIGQVEGSMLKQLTNGV